MSSISTHSLELPEGEDDNSHESNEPSTSSSRGRHYANADQNLEPVRHPYFTRSVARRSRTLSNESNADNIIEDLNRPTTSRNRLNRNNSISRSHEENQNFASKSLSCINQEPNRNLQHLGGRNPNPLAFTLLLSQENIRNIDMDYPPCRSNRIKAGSTVLTVCLSALIICVVGGVVWSIIAYLTSMQSEMCKIRELMGKMKTGGYKKSGGCKICEDKSFCDKKEDSIKGAIRQALEEFSADKTGKTDFALETAGGSIVGLVDTESYEPRAKTTLFGIPICSGTNGPRSLIQASTLPGECWAFKGSRGSVIIQLLGPVFIDGISLEHIPKSISPSGEIDTAPQDFTVWGLTNGKPGEGQQLGRFTYKANGDTLQHFPIRCPDRSYQYVQFSVTSNYGNPTFTCVYRLRVHGVLDAVED